VLAGSSAQDGTCRDGYSLSAGAAVLFAVLVLVAARLIRAW